MSNDSTSYIYREPFVSENFSNSLQISEIPRDSDVLTRRVLTFSNIITYRGDIRWPKADGETIRSNYAGIKGIAEMSIPNFFFPSLVKPVVHLCAFPRTRRRTSRADSTTWARFDFFSGPGMRAHLRQIVNTFIHVRQPRVLYSVVALDNETEAF